MTKCISCLDSVDCETLVRECLPIGLHVYELGGARPRGLDVRAFGISLESVDMFGRIGSQASNGLR